MAATSPIIRQVRLEVSTFDAQQGPRLPQRLSALFASALAAVLEAELGRAGPDRYLPQLVLELPPVALGRLEQDLPEQLRAALRTALASLPALPAAAADGGPLVVVRYFLLHGRLPWQASASFNLDQALRQAMVQQPGALRDLLRQLGELAAPRQRLARQLTPATLGQLLTFLEPVHAPAVRAYLAETLAAHHRRPLVPASAAELRQVLYELVLADLLKIKQTQFNRRAFVERQLRQLAAHYNFDFEALLRQLTLALPTTPGTPAAASLPDILRILRERAGGSPISIPTPDPDFADERLTSPTAAKPLVAATPAVADSLAPGSVAQQWAALLHYLRHDSLPPAWHEALYPTTIAARLAEVLRQGRSALHRLAREAGAAATAAALVRYLPVAARYQLLQALAPGQTRPLLALLTDWVKRAAPASTEAYWSRLWSRAFTYLLAEEGAQSAFVASQLGVGMSKLSLPSAGGLPLASGSASLAEGLRQWLTQQADLQLPASALTTREQLTQYLSGKLPTPLAVGSPPFTQLQDELRKLLREDVAYVRAFIGQHWAGGLVLRHLASLADATSLTSLLPMGQTRRQPAAQAALATLLDGPPPLRPSSRQRLLREAYLLFGLWARQRGTAPPATVAEELLRVYYLPGRALHTYLARQFQRAPTLGREPFVRWLLATLGSPAPRNPVPTMLITHQQLPAAEVKFIEGSLPAGAVSWPTARAQDQLFTQSKQPIARLLAFQQAMRRWAVEASPGSPYAPRRLAQRLPAALRLLGPPWPRQSGGRFYRLAGVATVAEARESLFAYLLRGVSGLPPELLRAAWQWLVGQQRAAVSAFLRQYGAATGVLPRAATLASADTLAMLLAGTGRRSQPPGRLSLAGLATSLGSNSRLLLLVKTAYLIFHYRPASQFIVAVQQQLATSGLPRKAVLARLMQAVDRRPAPGGSTFFRRLLAVLAAESTTGGAGWSSEAAALAQLPISPQLTSLDTYRLSAQGSDIAKPLVTSSINYAPEAAPFSTLGQRLPSNPSQSAQDLLLHYLRHGQAPWWHPAAVGRAELGRTFRQVARQQPQRLRAFLRQHAAEPTVRHQVAHLADFSMLHQLMPPPGASRHLVRPALAALDRTLRHAASQPRFQLLLRQAYFAFLTSAQPVGAALLAATRRLAAASGLSWHLVRTQLGRLLRAYPGLATDLFFRALLPVVSAQRPIARPRSLPEQRITRPLRSISKQMLSTQFSPARSVAAQPPALAGAWAALEYYLQTGQAARELAPAAALTALLRLADPAPAQLLRAYLGSAAARARLATLLSPTQLLQLLRWLVPAAHAELAGLLRDWHQLLARGLVRTGAPNPTPLWTEVLAATSALPGRRAIALATWLLHAECAGRPASPTVQQLLRGLGRSGLRLRSPLVALLVAQAATPPAPRQSALPAAAPPAPARPVPLRPRPQPAAPPAPEATYVANAGLVLLWPFLAMLFERVGYVAERQFKDAVAAERATHLLQFLVTGEENFPEYELVLNKLLCGVETARPLARAVPLTPEEKSTGEDLLRAVLSRWEVLRGTSIAGLRETFLQRPGRLDYHPDRVSLTVETKTVDILLDQRPWPIAVIKLPWMPQPLHVTWR